MSDQSRIEWTDTTWNPVTGCTKVSEGCEHCYIERTPPFRMAGRRFDKPGIGGTTGVQLHPDRLDKPLTWRKPRRVFVNSLSDLFHHSVPLSFIVDVFARMWWAPRHTFQLLTKRPARMRSLMPRIEDRLRDMEHDLTLLDCPTPLTWPLPNVWLGVSIESDDQVGRADALRDTPAAVRFISAEPLLGPLPRLDLTGIDWVIAGGESGPGSRPMDPVWARSLRDQCVSARVPFFFKQHGDWCHVDQMPEDTWSWLDSAINLGQEPHPPMHRVGKKRAGRLLDGRTWDEYPHG